MMDEAKVVQDQLLEGEAPGPELTKLTRLKIGQPYAFRTLGEIRLGRVVGEGPLGQVILADASWAADVGLWGDLCDGQCPREAEYEGEAVMGWAHILAAVPIPESSLPTRHIRRDSR